MRRRFLQGIGAWGRQRSILWALLPEIVKEMIGNGVLPLATPSERGADRNLGAPVAAQLRPVAQITAAEAVAAVEPRLPQGWGDPRLWSSAAQEAPKTVQCELAAMAERSQEERVFAGKRVQALLEEFTAASRIARREQEGTLSSDTRLCY